MALLAGLKLGHRHRLPARRWYAPESASLGGEHDPIVTAPARAEHEIDASDGDGRPAVQRDPLQRSVGVEADRLASGEKNRLRRLSVPAIGVASSSSSRRMNSCTRPLRSALNTMARPSGVNAIAVLLGRPIPIEASSARPGHQAISRRHANQGTGDGRSVATRPGRPIHVTSTREQRRARRHPERAKPPRRTRTGRGMRCADGRR